MENNNVSLSQDEVDKLLGIISHPDDSNQNKVEKNYNCEKIFSETELDFMRKDFAGFNTTFLDALKAKFGEPTIRKLTLTAVDQICTEEFFDTVSGNDFLYKVSLNGANVFLKLDSFLFGALSGLRLDPRHKINLFQSEVIRHFVVAIMAETVEKRQEGKVQVESLFQKDTKPYANNECGIGLTINWNENLLSFGVEKIFISKEFFQALKK
ncbi:MAG: hypothetical protein KBT11_10220 [Treponema sp.]|nr:hypothetical protein [Candidatus Treponema equifaecale]